MDQNTPLPSLRNHLIQGAFGSLGLQLGKTLFSLALAVMLARLLGVEGFGIYAFCLSVVNLLVIPSMLGGQQFMVREVAAYNAREEFHFLLGLVQRMRLATSVLSVFIACCAAFIGWWVYRGSAFQWPFLIAMMLIPLITAMNLQSAIMQGLRRVLLGQTCLILLHVLLLVLIAGIFLYRKSALTPTTVLVAYVACSGLLVLVFHALLRMVFPSGVTLVKPAHDVSRWRYSILPFMFVGAMQILNKETSVLLLGTMQGAESVGIFRVAQRGAELVPFGLLAVNMAIAPTVAELFARGEKQRLQQMISKSIIAVMAFAIPVALCLMLCGRWIIQIVFGSQYASAYIPLVILCAGQLFNACVGSVGIILNMVGLESLVARGVAIAALANVVLNIALIPWWGSAGAAIASSTSLVIWNLLLAYWLYRRTGLVTIFRFKTFS